MCLTACLAVMWEGQICRSFSLLWMHLLINLFWFLSHSILLFSVPSKLGDFLPFCMLMSMFLSVLYSTLAHPLIKYHVIMKDKFLSLILRTVINICHLNEISKAYVAKNMCCLQYWIGSSKELLLVVTPIWLGQCEVYMKVTD